MCVPGLVMDQDSDMVLIISSESDDNVDKDDSDSGFLLRLYSSFEKYSSDVQHSGQMSKYSPTANLQGDGEKHPKIKTKLKLPRNTSCAKHGEVLASCIQRSTANSFHLGIERSCADDDEGGTDSDFKIEEYNSSESEELFVDTEVSSKQLNADLQLEFTSKNALSKTKPVAKRKKLQLQKQKSLVGKGSSVSQKEKAVKGPDEEIPHFCWGKGRSTANNMQIKNMDVSQKNGELCKASVGVCLSELKMPISGCKSKYFESVKKSTKAGFAVVPETDSSDDFECVSPCFSAPRSSNVKFINLDSSSSDDDCASFSHNTSLMLSQVTGKSRKTSQIAHYSKNTSQVADPPSKRSQRAYQTMNTSKVRPKTKNASQVTCKTKNASQVEYQMRNTQTCLQTKMETRSGSKIKRKNSNLGDSKQKDCKRLKLSKYFGFSCSDSDSFVSFSDSDDGVIYRPKEVTRHKVDTDRVKSSSISEKNDLATKLVAAESSDCKMSEKQNCVICLSDTNKDDTDSDSLLSPRNRVSWQQYHSSSISDRIVPGKNDLATDLGEAESPDCKRHKKKIGINCLSDTSKDDTDSNSLLSPKQQVAEQKCQTSSVSDKTGSVSNVESKKSKVVLGEFDDKKEDYSDITIAWDDDGWSDCEMAADNNPSNLSSTSVVPKPSSSDLLMANPNSGKLCCDDKEKTCISEKKDGTDTVSCKDNNAGAELPVTMSSPDVAAAITAAADQAQDVENCVAETTQDMSTCSYSQVDIGDSDFSDEEIFASLIQSEFEVKKPNDAVNGDDNAYDEWTDDFLKEVDASFHEEHIDCDPCLLSDHDVDDGDLITACDTLEKSFYSSGESMPKNHHLLNHDSHKKEVENVLCADEPHPSSNDKQMSEVAHVKDETLSSKAQTSSADEEGQMSKHKASNDEEVSAPCKEEAVLINQHQVAERQAISDGNMTISNTDKDLQKTAAVMNHQLSECQVTGDEDILVSENQLRSAVGEHHLELQSVKDQETSHVALRDEAHGVLNLDTSKHDYQLPKESFIKEDIRTAAEHQTLCRPDQGNLLEVTDKDKQIQSTLDKQQCPDVITPCPTVLSSKTMTNNNTGLESGEPSPLPSSEFDIDHCMKCVVKLERYSADKLMCLADNAKVPAIPETLITKKNDFLLLNDEFAIDKDAFPEDPVPVDLQVGLDQEFGPSATGKTDASNKAEIKLASNSIMTRFSPIKVMRKGSTIKSLLSKKSMTACAKRSPTKQHTVLSSLSKPHKAFKSPIKHKARHHNDVTKQRKQQQKSGLQSPLSLKCGIKKAKAEMLRRQRLLESKSKTDASLSHLKTAIVPQKWYSNKEHINHLETALKPSNSATSKAKNTKSTEKKRILPKDSTDAYNSNKTHRAMEGSKSTGNVISETSTLDKAKGKHKLISLTEPHRMKPKVGKCSKQDEKCIREEEHKNHRQPSKTQTKTTSDLKTRPSHPEQKVSTDIFAVLNLKSPSPRKVNKPAESSKPVVKEPKHTLQQHQQQHQQQQQQQHQHQQQQVIIQRSKFIQPASTNQTSWQPSFDSILRQILKWSPMWFAEYEKVKLMPPVVKKEQLFPLLETYLTYTDYVRVITPHFLLETWHTSYNCWKKAITNSSVILHDVLPVYLQLPGAQGQGNSESNKFMDLYCQGILSPGDALKNNFTQEGDLVTLQIQCTDVQGQLSTKMILGYVLKSNKMPKKECNLHKMLEENLKYKPADVMILYTEIRLLHRRIRIDDKSFIKIQVISSLIGQLRQYQGLCYLPKSLLGSDILRPSRITLFTGPEVPESHNLQKKYNRQQSHAISMISAGFLLPYESPKLYLLQGPPGTGKSYAITGLIHRIIVKGINKRPRVRILVCAPSNNAVDELVRRLKHIDQSLRKAKQGELRVVRVGKVSSMQQDVIQCSLDEIFDKKWREYYSYRRQNAMDSVRMETKHLQEKLEYYHNMRKKLQQQGSTTQVRALESEMAKLEKRLNGITGFKNKSQLSAAEVYNIKREILMSAHVVCSTLNGSGGLQLMKYLRKAPGEIPFTSLIIDENKPPISGIMTSMKTKINPSVNDISSLWELLDQVMAVDATDGNQTENPKIDQSAGQCTELDTLIPLQYGVTKVVLVGDPEQLPPTVISKEAADQNYGQSLFERFYTNFKMRPDNPIMMLQTQYRMHPEVCSFPSKHVYMGKLKTDRAVHKTLDQNYPFKHYAVFDLEYSKEEQQQEGSIYNLAEAKFINGLCHYLLTYHKAFHTHDIGVITPYQKQRAVVQDHLHRDYQGLDVKTVDGFQGQEKNIIILSCVRAGSASGSIGFLADRRRMNVALTRARYACYVVGNVKSLQTNTDWRSLVEDAEERNVLLHIRTPADVKKAFDWLHK